MYVSELIRSYICGISFGYIPRLHMMPIRHIANAYIAYINYMINASTPGEIYIKYPYHSCAKCDNQAKSPDLVNVSSLTNNRHHWRISYKENIVITNETPIHLSPPIIAILNINNENS